MKQTVGRFLLQPNKNFPVDCETLDALQTNIALLQVLGNLAGDKTILLGCEEEQNGTRRKAGYVFLKTKDFPEGEVIYWEGGTVSGGMYVHQEIVPTTAQGYEFPQAYTVRSLKPGVGSENYKWGDFAVVRTPRELEEKIEKQGETLGELSAPPLGIIQIWAGKTVPSGYELCEGQQLKITDYPDLYKALGSTFNNAYSATGSRYSTSSGYFRMPDLRGRFIVGHNPSDTDYSGYGKAGGEKQHALTIKEMPSHTHPQNLWAEDSGTWKGGGRNSSPNSTSKHDRTTQFGNTNATGGGAAHENRPPYYVLAYIMRVR